MNCAEPQDFLRSLARICDQAEGRMRARVAKELHKPAPQVPASQQRVLDEKTALEPEQQTLLREQREVMWQCSEILGKRIALFK